MRWARTRAQECAPREAALATTHAEFVLIEFEQGDVRRATEHMEVAQANARSRSKKPRSAAPKIAMGTPSGITRTSAPMNPKTTTATWTKMAAPTLIAMKTASKTPQTCAQTNPKTWTTPRRGRLSEPDNDGDGIVDADDGCPDEPEP